ncbi:hypothetical protein EC957_006880 [Mortierella hygrophila]|uniref:Uncharacterized protein n=1 Tax=Mortierella hygrophila TaxID=979708 RepID=A0A9P6JYW1_9FUNG|nr:hypothetical protein EC957_006880 [Mortierella hygrophila]
MVADQWIKEPLPESEIETTGREPSRPLPVAPPPRSNRAWDHTAATTERPYRPGYKNAEKHADRILRADFMMASTSPHTAGPETNVPKFVEKAMEEYDQAMTAYRLNQHKLNKTTEKSTEKDATTDSITPSTVTEAPLPIPKPSPFIRQYSLRNLRRYPATVDAPHPPYRVVYVISKKVVSKLAVHRNLCRKKLSAAVEAVFREYACPGYEFMFFAKQQCVTTSQMDLEEVMIKTLMDPNLYADTALRNKGRYPTPVRPFGQVAATTATATSSLQPSPSTTQDSEVAKKSAVKIRWKNNQAPLKWDWWKHALPNPLGRTRQPDEYLDMHCPKPPGDKSTVDSAEHENAPSAESKK